MVPSADVDFPFISRFRAGCQIFCSPDFWESPLAPPEGLWGDSDVTTARCRNSLMEEKVTAYIHFDVEVWDGVRVKDGMGDGVWFPWQLPMRCLSGELLDLHLLCFSYASLSSSRSE